MVKLSEQRGVTPLQTRPTRTQRVLVKQEDLAQRKRVAEDQQKFNTLQDQARQLQETEFANISSVEEYKQKYDLLDSKLKPFFVTPTELSNVQTERIETTRSKVDNKIVEMQQKKKDVELAYRKHLEWLSRNNKSDDDADDEWSEDQAFYDNYIRGLQEAKGRLSAGQDLAYGDVLGYASNLGHYYKDRQEARNDGRRAEQRELTKLEGTKPFLIQEIEKGRVVKESIAFQDPSTKAFLKTSVPLSTSLRSVAGLQKSTLGTTEVTRTFELGAEKHEFITRPQLYQTPSGKLTTELGGITERTEIQIISEAREKAYQDFLKEYSEVELEKTEEDVLKVDDRKWYEKSIDELFIQPAREKVKVGSSFIFGKAGEGLDKIDEVVRWDFKITGTSTIPKVQLISFGKEKPTVDVGAGVEKAQTFLGEKSFDIKEGEIEKQLGVEQYASFKEEQEKISRRDVTSLFYRSEIGKEAFLSVGEEKEIIKAFEEYKETKEFKQYEKEFQVSYKEDLDLALSDVPYSQQLKGTGAGLKMAGLNLGSLGLSLVKSPTRLGLTAGALYGGGYALSSIPASTLVGLDLAFLTIGGVKTFSPSSTIEERGSGALLLGLAGTSLGIKGVTYARQPTIKTVKIKPPKATLRASEVVGKNVKVITEKGTINKVIFQNQKLSQVSVAGRRTVVSTRIRDWIGADPIYRGVPYAQKGTTYSYQSFGATITTTGKSAYQKATDLLIKRAKFTPAQASQTLRYIQPKVIEQYLSRGVLTIKGSRAVGEFQYLTKQPVITVDKGLGIKTRGARTIKDVYDVERKLINLKSGQSVVLQEQVRSSFFLRRGASPLDFKDFQFSRGIVLGKATKTKKGLDLLKTDIKGLKAFEEVTYKDLVGISLERGIFPSEKFLRLDIGRTKLINKLIDMRVKGYGVTPAKVTKTPLSKTFSKQVSEVKVESIKNILKQAGVSDQAIKTSPEILKQAPPTPSVSAKTQIKELLKVESKLGLGSKISFGLASISASAIKQDLKLSPQLKTNLKVNQILKEQLKSEIALKQAITPKSAQALATQQVAMLEQGMVKMPRVSPAFQEIPIVQPKLPKIPVIPIYFPPAKQTAEVKRQTKSVQDLLFLPDFTARALGLEAEQITEAQAKKKLKKLLSGLEIRRPVKVKF